LYIFNKNDEVMGYIIRSYPQLMLSLNSSSDGRVFFVKAGTEIYNYFDIKGGGQESFYL